MSPITMFNFDKSVVEISICWSVIKHKIQWIHCFLPPPCQRDRLMANAGDLRVISQAVTSVSQELAVLMDDVRTQT